MTYKTFAEEVKNLPKCEDIAKCIQCGTCTASCPISEYMDHAPRKLFAIIRTEADSKEEVLASNTPWYCASCYSCTVRCPQEIQITEVMYALKELALKEKTLPKKLVAPAFAQAFNNDVMRWGRVFEPGLSRAFIHRVGIKGAINNSKLGLGLLKKGRLPFFPSKVKNRRGYKKMIKKALELSNHA